MLASRLIRLPLLMTLITGPFLFGDEPADVGAVERTLVDDAGPGEEGRAADELTPLKRDEEVEYRLELDSGRTIDVGEVFREQGAEFYKILNANLRMARSPLLRINHPQSTQPLLLASRRGKVLNGPFASFGEDGAPVALIAYSKGQRSSSLLTWDESHRPLLFAQYHAGQLDGIRCLFQSCCEQCRSGHIWLVEEWDRGELLATHVVGDDGLPQSFDPRSGSLFGRRSAALEAATTTLAAIEKRIEDDELKLKQFIALSYESERQAAYDRIRLAQAQMSYRFMSAMVPRRITVRQMSEFM